MCCKYEVALKNLYSDKSPWNAGAAGRDTALLRTEYYIIRDQKKKKSLSTRSRKLLDQLRPAEVFKEVHFEPGI